MMTKMKLTEDELLKFDSLYGELECAEADLKQAKKMEDAGLKRKNTALEKLKPAVERGYKPPAERMQEEAERNKKEKEKMEKEKLKKGGK